MNTTSLKIGRGLPLTLDLFFLRLTPLTTSFPADITTPHRGLADCRMLVENLFHIARINRMALGQCRYPFLTIIFFGEALC